MQVTDMTFRTIGVSRMGTPSPYGAASPLFLASDCLGAVRIVADSAATLDEGTFARRLAVGRFSAICGLTWFTVPSPIATVSG